jgi:hypothetical protein
VSYLHNNLYYNWNRWYSPVIGRYVQADPIGKPNNLYSYSLNNPVLYVDTMGLKAGCSSTHVIFCLAKYRAAYEIWNAIRPGLPNWGVGLSLLQSAYETFTGKDVKNPITCDDYAENLSYYLNRYVTGCSDCCTVTDAELPFLNIPTKKSWAHRQVKVSCEDDKCKKHESIYDPWLRPPTF